MKHKVMHITFFPSKRAVNLDVILTHVFSNYSLYTVDKNQRTTTTYRTLKRLNTLVQSFSCVQLFVTQWMVAFQAPPSMGFSMQEY